MDTETSEPAPHTELQLEAWYKTGATIFSIIPGTVRLESTMISFTKTDGEPVFSFTTSAVKNVQINPAMLIFKTTQGNFWVYLFDGKKYKTFTTLMPNASTMSALAGSVKIEEWLKDQHISLSGLTQENLPTRQRKQAKFIGIFFAVEVIIAIIVVLTVNALRH